MGEKTGIAWTDSTFNPWIGCTKVSQGCKYCYAEELMANRYGRVEWGPTGTRSRTSEANWRKPLQWNKQAERQGKRIKVFCASLADVFEENEQLNNWRLDLFKLIEETPNLDWQLLTKRPENILTMIPVLWIINPLSNVWYGTSVEDKDNLWRIRELRRVPARIRFLSVEPQIDDIGKLDLDGIHWIIIGGESGDHARPFKMEWAKDLIDQCQADDVACFVKQLGSNPLYAGDSVDRLKDKKGSDWLEWPEPLRVREFPAQ